MRKTNICKNGHKLEGENIRIRKDRNGRIECRACTKDGRERFNARNPLYDTWKMMIRRCEDPSFKDWHLYGGKTPPVTVCERWRNSLENFSLDIGPKPSKVHMLDRIDGTQGYSPENCKWSTPKESARNTSTNRLISYDGKTLTLAEWAEFYGMKYLTLFMRIQRGWSIKEALTIPVPHK